jgi:CheY-like chemotaxis protein
MNLCVNARDAMPQGGTLSITAENRNLPARAPLAYADARTGPHVVISVTDTGTGIPPEILEKIFDPFFTTKDLGQGTGLGLSTALGIVQSHRGTINVYSEVRRGTTFTIYLPAQEKGPALAGAAAEQRAPRGAGQLVLVVDDEKPILHMVSVILDSAGYKCLKATNGPEAIELYRSRRKEVRAVLLDMMMPGMDGMTVLRRLLEMEPDLCVIAASGLRGHGRMHEMLAAGAKAFLQKPYSDEQLLDALSRVLGGGT